MGDLSEEQVQHIGPDPSEEDIWGIPNAVRIKG